MIMSTNYELLEDRGYAFHFWIFISEHIVGVQEMSDAYMSE